jgi:uncharacterized protein
VHRDSTDYVTRVHSSPLEIDAAQWNALLAASDAPTPFMRHEYLAALHSSASACEATGWMPQFVSLYNTDHTQLLASAPLYVKDHSYGEYIFDWAWARAYQEHGLRYYPKAVVAVPYTPVPGSRLLSKNKLYRNHLLTEQLLFCEQNKLSSLHALFISEDDKARCNTPSADYPPLMPRQTVQFHWTNQTPVLQADGTPSCEGTLEAYGSFDHYLSTLAQDKRKKIRAERRKVQDAGLVWRTRVGADISASDWDFFYRCYERTYLEHGNAPYLSPEFFQAMANTMPENWVMFIAMHQGQPIASSLVAINNSPNNTLKSIATNPIDNCDGSLNNFQKIAYGRYWGALARVDSLHFEACYYQPLQWCIENGYHRFEGGAQGEHKMARGLLPVATHSAHWLAQPQFADAVARFLEREGAGIGAYMDHLEERNPFKV